MVVRDLVASKTVDLGSAKTPASHPGDRAGDSKSRHARVSP